MKRKILLLCAMGMSTGIIVQKMRSVAEKHDLDVEVEAVSFSELSTYVKEYDIFLIGPQIKFKYDEIVTEVSKYNKPVMLMSTEDYGSLRGDKILKSALVMLKEHDQKK